MFRYLLVAMVCLSATGIYAQNGTVSPYSFFGIGDLRSIGTVENQMMGGLSMYADSIHVNLRNPAAYGRLRLTTYSAALSHKELSLTTSADKANSSVTNLEYLALGFPVGRHLGFGFGIMPFSSVGYNLVQRSVNSNGADVLNEFSGNGGLDQLYISAGLQLAENLHIGATVNFNFGTLNNNRVQSVQDVQLGTLDRRESRVNGFDFNYGATYYPKITDKLTLFTSVTVNTQANLVSQNTQTIGSFSRTTGLDIEVVEVDLVAQGRKNTEIKIPTTATVGLGIGEDKKWFVGAEYSMQELSTFENEFITYENLAYQDASTLAVGGYFVPNYSSFSSYLKRITYRAGLRYNQSGIIVNDEEINNFGITFGLGLPLGRDFSNLNLGFEIGKRGTAVNDLVEESYVKVNLGLSFNSLWFQKRKIN
ncbi:hypothetical protein [Lentiprolixibacter aurantiacus]|uniref:Long-chain fatty acid transport protein n=1 Tax=Lentiprolixibacter aurantiacus TaxID=2993939 RepID=A0AAE3MIY5_9FLAO|nr:hypothetical protein [Lentiprolixibacter aurantiacus]MCX2718088.1 hypothetical protein [Lentiprolixibacter aurantiacus]